MIKKEITNNGLLNLEEKESVIKPAVVKNE